MGLAMAQHLARAGAKVVLAARSKNILDREARILTDQGLEAEARQLDIADFESIDALAHGLADIDILVNVAGTNIRKRFQEYTPEEYNHILQTNLHGFVRLTQKIGASIINRGRGGKIINIGSLTSLLGFPYISIYGVSKSAIAGLTRTLAAEWGKYNIQVNCIAPGFIITELNRKMWEAKEMHDWLRGSQANPRAGTPEDVAPLAVFLAGTGSDYISGQVICVDGGFSTTGVWPFEP
jgi:NAD(P)-dependent dehydrogenase (short-subunit alcohol dehydrogenase family)